MRKTAKRLKMTSVRMMLIIGIQSILTLLTRMMPHNTMFVNITMKWNTSMTMTLMTRRNRKCSDGNYTERDDVDEDIKTATVMLLHLILQTDNMLHM